MLAAARQHCCSCSRTTAARMTTAQRAPFHRLLLPHLVAPRPQQQRLPLLVPAQLSSHRWQSSSSSVAAEDEQQQQQPKSGENGGNGDACGIPSRKASGAAAAACPMPEPPLPPYKFRLDREVSRRAES